MNDKRIEVGQVVVNRVAVRTSLGIQFAAGTEFRVVLVGTHNARLVDAHGTLVWLSLDVDGSGLTFW